MVINSELLTQSGLHAYLAAAVPQLCKWLGLIYTCPIQRSQLGNLQHTSIAILHANGTAGSRAYWSQRLSTWIVCINPPHFPPLAVPRHNFVLGTSMTALSAMITKQQELNRLTALAGDAN